MNCGAVFQQSNYSAQLLNHAFNDDSGTWWWWVNVIGTLLFGVIGLIGNLISFLVIYRFSFAPHSFVEYLRVISLFDFLTLLYELVQALNKLCVYKFAVNLLNLRYSFVCKFYDYFKYSIIILSCWSIAALSIDRFILVCRPFAKRWPNLPGRICTAKSARRIILTLVCSSLLINIPHLIWKEWICRQSGFQHSAPFASQFSRNQSSSVLHQMSCTCRVSPKTPDNHVWFFFIWFNYVFHLTFYTLIPAVILITSNAAILKRLHTPRSVVSHQNEHLRSKLTVTLTLVSLIFFSLYMPYAMVQILTYFVVRTSWYGCNIIFVLRLRIVKRLSELLNIGALGINFIFYILAVTHYRSSAIRMLRLDQVELFTKFLGMHHNNRQMKSLSQRSNPDCSNIQLVKIVLHHESPHVSVFHPHESTQF